jgi:DedD protein
MNRLTTAPMNHSEDTEITLGTGKMLALFFGLVILCATFFAMGYSMGRNSAKSNAELLPSPGTSSPARVSPAPAQVVGGAGPSAEPATPPAEPPQTASHANAEASSAGAASSSQPPAQGALPPQPGSGYFVQVAAVSKQEDAQALVEALKGRQYEAFIADSSADKLFHVQVGPFADVKEAENIRTRLVNDGYNPILKK